MAKKLPVPISKEDFDLLLNGAKKEREEFTRTKKKRLTARGVRINQYIISIILGFGSGMRISEIVGLKGRIQPLNKDQIESNYIRIKSGKGEKDRIVPLPSKLFRYAGITRKELNDNLPLKISRRALQHYIKKLGVKVLKKHISFHMLRHGFVTHLLNNGRPIHEVQMLAGHSRMDTTGLYSHANPTKALEGYEESF